MKYFIFHCEHLIDFFLQMDIDYWKLRCESMEKALKDSQSKYQSLECEFNAGEEELAKLKDTSEELEDLLEIERKKSTKDASDCPEVA